MKRQYIATYEVIRDGDMTMSAYGHIALTVPGFFAPDPRKLLERLKGEASMQMSCYYHEVRITGVFKL